MSNIYPSQLLKYDFVNIALLNMDGYRSFRLKGFRSFLTSSGWFLGLGLFQNMFHNLLIYTKHFCFGYIAVSCFFETFPAGWVVGKSDFNENPVVSLDLDLDFGLRLKVCPFYPPLTPIAHRKSPLC